jgi:DNA-binding MarR family transcriptional regulator
MDHESFRGMAGTCAAYNLRRATRLVTQAFDQALKPAGLKVTQLSLLVAFLLSPGSNLAQLAGWLGMDRTTLSRNLRILQKRGLVEIEPGDDRREQLVKVTPAGKEAVKRAHPLWEQAQGKVVSALGEEKWAAMVKDLRALAAGLE